MRRRARRGRMFAVGLFFIIYSALKVYSSSDIDGNSALRPDFDANDLSTLLPKLSTTSSNDDVPVSASTLETPISTTTTTTTGFHFDFFHTYLLLFVH